MEEKLKIALEERDIYWQEKMAGQERSHAEVMENKVCLFFNVTCY